MAIDNFIPEIWASATAEALQQSAVVAPITNTSYTGQVRKGNTLHLTGVVPPTISDYAAAGRLTEAEDISDEPATLLIDQEKAFDFHVDDINKVQVAGSFNEWTTAAGRALGEDADRHILAQAMTGGTNSGLSAPSTGDEAHDVVRDLRMALNKAGAPQGERYIVMNSEFESLFLSADAKLTSVDTSGTPAGLRDAQLGRYLNFNLVVSDLFGTDRAEAPTAVAFWRPALAYISQIDQVETMRSHTKFADRVRGLHVFGASVVDFYAGAVQVFAPGAATDEGGA